MEELRNNTPNESDSDSLGVNNGISENSRLDNSGNMNNIEAGNSLGMSADSPASNNSVGNSHANGLDALNGIRSGGDDSSLDTNTNSPTGNNLFTNNLQTNNNNLSNNKKKDKEKEKNDNNNSNTKGKDDKNKNNNSDKARNNKENDKNDSRDSKDKKNNSLKKDINDISKSGESHSLGKPQTGSDTNQKKPPAGGPAKQVAKAGANKAKAGADKAKTYLGRIKAAVKSDNPMTMAKHVAIIYFMFIFTIINIFMPVILPLGFGATIITGVGNSLTEMWSSIWADDEDTSYTKKESNKIEDNYLSHKQIIDEALESKVYPQALSDAEALSKELGYDWATTQGNLSATDSDSWEKVFGEINYIDLIVGINIAYSEQYSTTVYDNVDIEEVMNNKEVIPHLYYFTYEEREVKVSEKKTEMQLFIQIHSFAMEDLAAIAHMDLYDYMKDSLGVSYIDQLEIGITFANDLLSKNAKEILNALKGTPYYHETETDIYEIHEEYAEIDLSNFDTSEWYSSTEGVVAESDPNAEESELFNNWLRLYDAPTMNIKGTTFYVNVQKARSDIAQDIAANVDNISSSSTPSGWCGYEFGSGAWNSGKANCVKTIQKVRHLPLYKDDKRMMAVDDMGRYYVAVAPGIMKPNYWSETGGVGDITSYYHYQTAYLDLVVKEKSTGKVYYIPCHVGDAKGHSFPYGIVQTGIATPRTASQQVQGAVFNADSINERDFAFNSLGSVQGNGYESIMNKYSSELKRGTGYTMYQWTTHGTVEFCWVGNSNIPSTLNSSFELLGIITY